MEMNPFFWESRYKSIAILDEEAFHRIDSGNSGYTLALL